MSHCHSEHVAHGGSGGGGGGDHEHDHSDDITPALQHSLYEHIDFDHIHALNERRAGSARAIVKKEWTKRLAPKPELQSDADEQIIVTIPFTGQVKLHSILLRTSASPSAPKTLAVFQNRDDIDFDAATAATAVATASTASTYSSFPSADYGNGGVTQQFDLAQTSAVQELPVKRARFGSVRSLTLFFPDNFGDGDEDVTRLSYVGFKGEWMRVGRAPENILYEAAANPGDHKVKGVGWKKMGGGYLR